ncbi:MAG: hypothetical protein AB8H79_16535, partial [Myxococcota bacterium]
MQQIPRIAIHAGEQRRIYQVLDDVLTLGDGQDADIRISGAGLQQLHLRVVRMDDGFRLECLGSEGSFDFEGEARRDVTLKHGDSVQLEHVELTFLIEAPDPEPRARSRRREGGGRGLGRDDVGRAGGARRRQPKVRRAGMPTWAVASCVMASLVAVAALVLQATGGGGGRRSTEDYLELARQQWERGASAEALSTLELARMTADGGERRAVDLLEGRIHDGLQARVDATVIQNGRTDLRSMRNVEERYLVPDPSHRPAARELMRQVATWESMYGEPAARLPEFADLKQQVRMLRTRYGAVAAMDEPDHAEDVLFSAQWRMRLKPRRLLEALEMVEDWLAQNGDTPEVLECKADCEREATKMVDAQLTTVRILLARDDLQGARSKLEEL